jgi:uncharacterized protein YjbJ (UPF0337 family)
LCHKRRPIFNDDAERQRGELFELMNSVIPAAIPPNPQQRRSIMNWDSIKGKWKEVKGKVREKWGKLTDSDMDEIEGKREQLVGKLQQHYGYAKEAAEKEVDEFSKNCNC